MESVLTLLEASPTYMSGTSEEVHRRRVYVHEHRLFSFDEITAEDMQDIARGASGLELSVSTKRSAVQMDMTLLRHVRKWLTDPILRLRLAHKAAQNPNYAYLVPIKGFLIDIKDGQRSWGAFSLTDEEANKLYNYYSQRRESARTPRRKRKRPSQEASSDVQLLGKLNKKLRDRNERLEEEIAKLRKRLRALRTASVRAEQWEGFSAALPVKSIWHAELGEDVDIVYKNLFREKAVYLLSKEERGDLQESLLLFSEQGFRHKNLVSAQVEYSPNGVKGSYWASVACEGYSFIWHRLNDALVIENLEPTRSLRSNQKRRSNRRLLGVQKFFADIR